MDVWERLGSPKLVLAPMVDASELAWRILSRRHGAQLCFTPMLHSSVFVRDARYRHDALASCPEDKPLIVQFCGHDPDTLVKAALLAQAHADGIDINLGCPQAIAKRGRYGAFLQDEWPLLTEIVTKMGAALTIPVSCKIRIYSDIAKTVEYAQLLVKAGAKILTVHGRTRDQKGRYTGIANWNHIKAVKEAVNVPVIANGNVQCIQDVERCLLETGVDAVMSAEGNLYNPRIFEGVYPPAWEVALEYLDLVDIHPCPSSYTRGHLFKICQPLFALPENIELRSILAGRADGDEFRTVILALKDKYLAYHEGTVPWTAGYSDSYDLVLPPWLCQPYVRPPPDNPEEVVAVKRVKSESEGGLSKRQQKRLKKGIEKKEAPGRKCVEICNIDNCYNPAGLKCDSQLCKVCCRTKCYENDLDCIGHGILIKTRRAKARLFQQTKKKEIGIREVSVQVT